MHNRAVFQTCQKLPAFMLGCVLSGCQSDGNLVFLSGCYAVSMVFWLVAYWPKSKEPIPSIDGRNKAFRNHSLCKIIHCSEAKDTPNSSGVCWSERFQSFTKKCLESAGPFFTCFIRKLIAHSISLTRGDLRYQTVMHWNLILRVNSGLFTVCAMIIIMLDLAVGSAVTCWSTFQLLPHFPF